MSKDFQPKEPHGVLYDHDGNVCLRFAQWDTDRVHQVPDYVETDREPHYVTNPVGHEIERHPLEAHPSRDDLPDPATPPNDENPADEFRPDGAGQ